MCTFTVLVLASALLLGPCWAVQFTTTEYNVLQGKPFTLQWEGAKGPVEISLLNAESLNNFETVQVIDSGDTRNSYTWTPPDLLLAGTYAFGISDGVDKNYSPVWDYDYAESGSGSTSMSSSTSASTSTRTMATTTMSTTSPLTTAPVTTSPKTTTSLVSTPKPTPMATSSASDSGDTSSSSLPTGTTTIGSTSSGAPGSESANPSSSPSSNPDTSSIGTQQSHAGGLSTGAKIGIGVGAGLGGLAVLGVALLLVFRRGKAAGQRAAYVGNNNQESKAELGDDPRPRAELGGQGIAEIQSGHDGWRGQPSELDASPYSYRGNSLLLLKSNWSYIVHQTPSRLIGETLTGDVPSFAKAHSIRVRNALDRVYSIWSRNWRFWFGPEASPTRYGRL
ncbi:hypothetical protein FHL15_006404 [Xylaria flabelliformis]|uniref:Mid2 domain-containing protein n=1 Tax=Xylaria flabelliformis TaxID=2512241 RepID=A0A553HXQ9_9PEZI|nr:hypothetical protein FHL15_006404 [Xylaria flabelliformis]